jgi:hypothetical protein
MATVVVALVGTAARSSTPFGLVGDESFGAQGHDLRD